jgi:hypothetical protein
LSCIVVSLTTSSFNLSPVIIPNLFAVSLVAIYFVGVEHVYNWFTIMELATLIVLAGTFFIVLKAFVLWK